MLHKFMLLMNPLERSLSRGKHDTWIVTFMTRVTSQRSIYFAGVQRSIYFGTSHAVTWAEHIFGHLFLQVCTQSRGLSIYFYVPT